MLVKSLKSISKDTFIYALGSGSVKVLTLFSIILLTRQLSQYDYGILDTVLSFSNLFFGLVVLGQDSAIVRFFIDKKDDLDYKREVISTGLFIQGISICVLVIIALFSIDRIGNFIYANKPQAITYWKLSLFALPGNALLLFSMGMFKWTFQKDKFLLLTIGNIILNILFIVFFVIYLKLGILGVIIANVISTNLFGILGLILCRKDLNFACFKNKFRYARKMIIYGLPFSMIMVIGTLLPSLDRFFLIRYTEYSQIAIYSISGKISSLLAFITDAFSLAFYPFAFSILDKNESAKIFEKIFQGYLFLFSFLAVLITAFSSTIIQVLFGSDYFKATMFLPPLLMANFFQAMLEFTLLGIFISKKTIFNLIIYLLGIAVLFISNFFLVPVFFIMGAAVSLLITKILMNVFAYLISRRLYHLHLDFVLVFKTLILVCGYFLIFYLNCNFPNYFLQKLNILSSILFPVASFYIILSTSDRSRIINEGRKLLRFREL